MTKRLENLIGAFANSIVDAVSAATQSDVDVSGPSAAALALINHEPGLTIGTLRYGLGLTHAGTVRLINRLEKAGLVRREPSIDDKRAVTLHLMPAGQAACDKLLSTRQRILRDRLSSLADHELEALEGIVGKLLKSATKRVSDAYAVCRLCDAAVCDACPVEAGLRDSRTNAIHA